nr:IclR family transcriptional regulator [Mesorhizobium sp. WSM4875]
MDSTVVKGLELIEALAGSKGPRGVTSLAAEMGLTKSNVHRLLNTLAGKGYVKRDASGLHYELSPKLWELGLRVFSRLRIADVAKPFMQDLARSTGETVHLSILDGFEVVYIDKIEGSQPIRAYTEVGGRAPAWCVATGKAMLAAAKVDPSLLDYPLPAYTEHSLTTRQQLAEEFQITASRGYAVNKGEWRKDVFGIAAAVCDGAGNLVGAIGISGPGSRFGPQDIEIWGRTVTDRARALSQIFGGPAV